MDISDESCRWYHSDVSLENFLVGGKDSDSDSDPDEIWMIDFQHVGVLPESFASYGLYGYGDRFSKKVGEVLDFPRSKHLRVMGRASGLIVMSGGGSLGA